MCAMSAFIPTIQATLRAATTKFTVAGKRQYADPVPVGISVIRALNLSQPTSVRADTSGTKSFADESIIKGRALIYPCVSPKIDDLLFVRDDQYEIKGVRKVYDMSGGIDHYEVELAQWVSE